jgi:4-amino-4-deoxy-L-arabinose transferase-like glycosyltransferase
MLLVIIVGGTYALLIDPAQRAVVGYLTRLPNGITWTLVGDEADYVTLAMNLLRHGTYSLSVEPPYEASSFRVPGYPMFLTAAFWVFGVHLNVVLVAGLVLLIIIAMLAFFIGRDLYGERVGVMAAFLCAINPGLYFFALGGKSEPLFCALLLLSIYFSNRADDSIEVLDRWSILSGLALALTFLTRPTVLILPLVFAGWLGRHAKMRGVRTLRKGGLLLLAFSTGVLPWAIRNQVSIGHFHLLPTQGGGVFLRGSLAAREGSGSYVPRERVGPEDHAIMTLKDEGLQDRESWCKGVMVIREISYAKLFEVVLKRIGRFWAPLNRIVYDEFSVRANLLANVIYTPLFVLFLVGSVVEGLRQKKSYLLFLTMAYCTIPAMLFHGGTRHRMPIEPLMAIFSALAVVRFIGPRFSVSASVRGDGTVIPNWR